MLHWVGFPQENQDRGAVVAKVQSGSFETDSCMMDVGGASGSGAGFTGEGRRKHSDGKLNKFIKRPCRFQIKGAMCREFRFKH